MLRDADEPPNRETLDDEVPRVLEGTPPDPPPPDGRPPRPHEPAVPPVRLRHTHPHWVNREGERLDPAKDSDMVVNVARADVRHPIAEGDAAGGAPVSLSVLVVRWGGEPTRFNEEQARESAREGERERGSEGVSGGRA